MTEKELLDKMEPENEMEEKLLHIHALEQVHEIDVREELKNYKGAFSYQGGYIDYHEWHSFVIGAILLDLGFRLQEGAFIYFYLFTGIIVFKHTLDKCEKPSGVLGEIGKNFHYYLGGGLLVTVLWLELTGVGVPSVSDGTVTNLVMLLDFIS